MVSLRRGHGEGAKRLRGLAGNHRLVLYRKFPFDSSAPGTLHLTPAGCNLLYPRNPTSACRAVPPVAGKIPKPRAAKMISLSSETDRTFFFDFLPLDLGTVRATSRISPLPAMLSDLIRISATTTNLALEGRPWRLT